MNVTTCAEGFLALAVDVYSGNGIVLGPLKKLTEHDFDHLSIERVKDSRHIQGQSTYASIALAQG